MSFGKKRTSFLWHTCALYRNSRFFTAMEAGVLDGIILGDSGYPLNRWLYTPVPSPQDGADQRYNIAHRRTRCWVEHAFGILKMRFRVLHSECRLQPVKLCKVATACAALHNIAIDNNDLDQLPELELDDDDNVPENLATQAAAVRERRDYVVRYFGR